MAKKKLELTSEELLAEALVREEDWPYEVPGNWVWTRLGSVAEYIQRGKSPKYSETEQYPVISQKCVQWSGFDPAIVRFVKPDSIDTYGEERFIQKGDILWNSTGTGTIGRLSIYNDELKKYEKVVADSHVTVVRVRNLCKKYIYFYLTSPRIQGEIEKRATGTTNQIELNTSTIVNQLIPLPPLAEQQRIVDRIESLFDQLDQAKDLIQEALDSFETRKAAILHQAFTGQLTKKWRAAHGVGLESWEETKISEICDIVRGGSPRPAGDPLYYDGEIPFLKVADITHSEDMYIKSFKYSIKEAGLKKTRLVEPDTLLLTNSGATLGVPGITSFKTTFNDGIAAFLGLEKDSLKFFYYFWTSKTQELRGINKGAAQPNLNTEIIGNVEISLPSVPEQHEIANILDDLFAKEQKANDLCDLIDQIEAMKKTILGQAFRGELGTNVAGEENAVALLQQVLSQK